MLKIQSFVKITQNLQTPTSHYTYFMDSDKRYPYLSINIQNSHEILDKGKGVSNIDNFY